MYDSIIKLIAVESVTDEYGDTGGHEVEREVYAQTKSIGRTEFYQAQAVGAKPEIKFCIADYLDYHGEKKLKYTDDLGKEDIYTVIRTYRTGNELEITCKRGVET